MSDIKRLFRELYFEVFKISIVHTSADTIIFFTVALNITTLLNVTFFVALAASVIFMIADLTYRMKRTTLKEIEKKNPQLQDILSTARDNSSQNNFMVFAMFEDLIKKMKSVSAGSLMNPNKLMIKILIVCMLCFSVIFVSANNIHVPKSVFDPGTYYKLFSKQGSGHMDFYTIEFNETEGLYGDPELADLGNQTIELHINPSINEMSFENIKEPEEKEFEKGTFPSEISAVSDSSSEEKLPKESKIAIAYNLKIKEQT